MALQHSGDSIDMTTVPDIGTVEAMPQNISQGRRLAMAFFVLLGNVVQVRSVPTVYIN